MQQKYKMTGCAKFMIFLIFFAPIAYFSASAIHGGDGFTGIKDKIESIIASGNNSDNPNNATTKGTSKTSLQTQINELNRTIRKQNLEIQYLKSKLAE